MAWGTWLEIPQTLLAPSTIVFGASYADVHARIPFLWVTIGVLVIGAGLADLARLRTARLADAGRGRALALVVTIAGGIYAGFVQRFIVTPNELDKEQPYITYNIAATRKAYALDRVDERELPGDAELTPKDIVANAGTDRERPAVGPPAAAADVRADSGNPDVLRLHVPSTTTAT